MQITFETLAQVLIYHLIRICFLLAEEQLLSIACL